MAEAAWSTVVGGDFVPTVPPLLKLSAERYGDHDCVVTSAGRLTYRQLDSRSRSLAARLVACGVGKGTRVGLLMPNSAEWVLVWAAAARVGALVIPVNTYYRPSELARFLRHADIAVLVCATALANRRYIEDLEAISGSPQLADADDGPIFVRSLPHLRRVLVWGSCVEWSMPESSHQRAEEESLAHVVAGMEADVHPGDPAVVIYTSGTTGDPKGVIHTHGTVVRHALNMAAVTGITHEDVLWSPMPLFWVGGFEWCLMRAIAAGATYVTQEVYEPRSALGLITGERVSIVHGWPQSIARLAALPEIANADLSVLRSARYLWSALPEGRQPNDPGLMPTGLGMTETCGPHTLPTPEEEAHGTAPEYRGSYGHPIPGTEHRIIDPTTGADLEPGEEGEIIVRGYNLLAGLYKKERAEVFEPDGWYRTGDRGFFRDDRLFFAGRLDNLIKTSGANVSPDEVEQCLRSRDGVEDAFVVGIPARDIGEAVVALVVPVTGGEVDPAALIRALHDDLASYKVPRRILLVAPEDVPLLPSQKPDRRRLRAMAEAQFGDEFAAGI